MDNPTLLLALAVLSSICSVALIANWASNRFIPGLFRIAIGYTISTAGILLLTTQGTLPPILSGALATTLVMGGRIPMLFGLAAFWHQSKSSLPIFCLLWFVGSVIGFFYFTLIDDSVLWRTRIFVAMMEVFFILGAIVLVRGLRRERRLRPTLAISTTYGAYFLIGLFLFNAVIDGILLLTRPVVPLAGDDPSTFFLLLTHFVTMITIGFAVIMMTMEELSVDYKENAVFDPITTALNHRTFLEMGQRALGAARRHDQPVSLLTIEIMNFARVAREHDAKTANKLLRHFTRETMADRRHEDILGRSSTCEFRLLLPGVDEAGAASVMGKLKDTLSEQVLQHHNEPLRVEMAIAATTRRGDALSLQLMLLEGEMAVFKLKQQQAYTRRPLS